MQNSAARILSLLSAIFLLFAFESFANNDLRQLVQGLSTCKTEAELLQQVLKIAERLDELTALVLQNERKLSAARRQLAVMLTEESDGELREGRDVHLLEIPHRLLPRSGDIRGVTLNDRVAVDRRPRRGAKRPPLLTRAGIEGEHRSQTDRKDPTLQHRCRRTGTERHGSRPIRSTHLIDTPPLGAGGRIEGVQPTTDPCYL